MKNNKLSEDLKTEISSLKIRLRRIEQFLLEFPNAEDHIQDRDELDDDELFEAAKELVRGYNRASASLLQRQLGTGYARAARLIDQLEEAGVIGPEDGAKPREVLKVKTNKK